MEEVDEEYDEATNLAALLMPFLVPLFWRSLSERTRLLLLER